MSVDLYSEFRIYILSSVCGFIVCLFVLQVDQSFSVFDIQSISSVKQKQVHIDFNNQNQS